MSDLGHWKVLVVLLCEMEVVHSFKAGWKINQHDEGISKVLFLAQFGRFRRGENFVILRLNLRDENRLRGMFL